MILSSSSSSSLISLKSIFLLAESPEAGIFLSSSSSLSAMSTTSLSEFFAGSFLSNSRRLSCITRCITASSSSSYPSITWTPLLSVWRRFGVAEAAILADSASAFFISSSSLAISACSWRLIAAIAAFCAGVYVRDRFAADDSELVDAWAYPENPSDCEYDLFCAAPVASVGIRTS